MCTRVYTRVPTATDWRYLFVPSVAQGLSLNSHATRCAMLYGISKSIVQRAELVRCALLVIWCGMVLIRPFCLSDLVSSHAITQLLDEDMTQAEVDELQEAEGVCRAFLAWDIREDSEGLKDRLGIILEDGRAVGKQVL